MLLRWLLKLVFGGAVMPDGSGRSGETFLDDATHGRVFHAVADCSRALLHFFHIIHHGGVWLDPTKALDAANSINLFCSAYNFLAREFYRRGQCVFHLEPSIHMLKHVPLRLEAAVSRGAPVVLSPAIFLCELSEDFVGRTARISRRVNGRTVSERTVQRMLIKYHHELGV